MAEAETVREGVREKGKRELDLNDNVVFVGKKDTMSYIFAVMTQFNNGAKEVILKARGKAISRAVDVAERIRNQFITDARPSDIRISTEEIQGEEGTVKVSAIEITLSK
jgi:DNA-binding protein